MKINISIDDVSPHPLSSVKVLDRCFEIINKIPEAKFSLFVPMAYWRTTRPDIATRSPLRIDAFPEFCNILKNLPSKNFEVCYHGLFHGIPRKNDNDEFHEISKEEALQKFQIMFEIAKFAGLQDVIKPIFRPPAWRMSPGAIKSAKEAGIRTLALSPVLYAKETYQKADESFEKVIYYDCAPPFTNLPSKVVDSLEIVYHACEWDKNYLSPTHTNELLSWIEELSFDSLIEYKFIEDLR